MLSNFYNNRRQLDRAISSVVSSLCTSQYTRHYDQTSREGTTVATDTSLYRSTRSQSIGIAARHVASIQHPLVKSGRVILQDKSSCFSALCLIHGNDVPLKVIVWMPVLLQETRRVTWRPCWQNHRVLLRVMQYVVHALDRSSTRLALLDQRMQQLVIKIIPQQEYDSSRDAAFGLFKDESADYPKVRGILLDPSCSGSGIFTSPNRRKEKRDEERIASLSNFQLTTLLHAMSFSQVERIVYSTCSLHDEENEFVVSQALVSPCNQDSKDGSGSIWKLVAPSCLQHWKRRGHVVVV